MSSCFFASNYQCSFFVLNRFKQDWFVIGALFAIQPLCKQLYILVNDEAFRNFLQYAPSNCVTVQDDTKDVKKINQCLAFLFRETKLVRYCFADQVYYHDGKSLQANGRLCYFSNLSCCGISEYNQIKI